ncbi:MAG: DUF4258 domain-containing protein [Betaproteobacteria bacterium]|nr:DUF4258 domain-containing protein [Betaproteobacteria bacterium]NBP45354.1 DUF4258 domain-containing protein [Betaproteobacteria bacterium]
MRERHMTRLQVLEVLRHGVIRREPEPGLQAGHVLCRLERVIAGHHLGVVIALDGKSAVSGWVVTALWIGG